MTLRLITFDLDDTLWACRDVILEAERLWVEWLCGAYPAHASRLSASHLRAMRDRLLLEQPSYRDRLTALRHETCRRALLDFDVDADEARVRSEQAFLVFHEARNRVSVFAGVREVLAQMKRSYCIGALTNGNADLETIGLAGLFDFHHSAESVGRRKPAPEMFHAALLSAGVSPAEALHVGDSPIEDVDAARRLGFGTVWVRRPGALWPEGLPPAPEEISEIGELPALVRKLEGGCGSGRAGG